MAPVVSAASAAPWAAEAAAFLAVPVLFLAVPVLFLAAEPADFPAPGFPAAVAAFFAPVFPAAVFLPAAFEDAVLEDAASVPAVLSDAVVPEAARAFFFPPASLAAALVDLPDADCCTAVFFATMAAAPSHIVILLANRAGTINRLPTRGNGA
ncbi:hypothetical protein ACFCYX_10330 [Streptomyces populi]|uniref:hypothetical protein n=1 Tax=Streptomyces populi TaxID=2058924 RepID=UPI0030B85CC0